MIRRPPRSTLFPYTTALPISTCQLPQSIHLTIEGSDRLNIDNQGRSLPTIVRVYQLKNISRMEDRKSTRLNSSHSQISYAVFCLKKKKKRKDSKHIYAKNICI